MHTYKNLNIEKGAQQNFQGTKHCTWNELCDLAQIVPCGPQGIKSLYPITTAGSLRSKDQLYDTQKCPTCIKY